MSDETEADIVLQLDTLATYAERADHWAGDKRLMGAAGVADTLYGAIDRIKELETQLAKAEVVVRIVASAEWDERLGEAVDLSCEYLAERKGQEDE